jgi:succinoglycan biosynthesis protein ExoO
MQPDVSFVVAAFNAEATLGRAVRSALDQQSVTVEVIVVDDCSTDRTLEVARALSAEPVRVVALDENGGPGAGRNAGLSVARGRWIAVLDADDAVHPQRTARLIERAQTAGAAIAVDNLEVVDEASGSVAMFPPAMLEQFPELTLAGFIGANCMFENTFSFGYMKPLIARRFVEEQALRYPETLRIGEDYIFLASALAKGGRCVVEPRPGYAYHVRCGSISRVLELHHVEAMLAADAAFLRDHRLDAAALAAQARRTRSLEEAAAFLSLVRHVKDGALLKALGGAMREPAALKHLRMPLAVRFKRLARAFEPKAIGQSA